MNRDELRAVQAPLKERYRSEPDAGLITLKAEGRISERITCSIQTGKALVEAGLHPATGGAGTFACSGDMLLEALAACAGVTMAAVATSIGVDLRSGTVRAEGDLDFKRFLRRKKVLGSVKVRAEGDSIVLHFAEIAQAEHLEAARVGKDRVRPGHELMKAAHATDKFVARAQI